MIEPISLLHIKQSNKITMLRDINSEENQKIKKLLEIEIDEMFKYRASHQFQTEIRANLTGQSCFTKKHFNHEMNGNKIIKSINSDVGITTIRAVIKVSTNKSIINEALKRMEIDINDIYRFMSSQKSKLNIDTSALKYDINVINKKNEYINKLLTYENEVNFINEDTLTDEDKKVFKRIIARQRIMKEILENKSKYIYHYNKMRSLFEEASLNKQFPRNFEYRGVIMGWETIMTTPSLNVLVKDYLENMDMVLEEEMYIKYKNILMEIGVEKNLYTLRLLLDDIDYFDEDKH